MGLPAQAAVGTAASPSAPDRPASVGDSTIAAAISPGFVEAVAEARLAQIKSASAAQTGPVVSVPVSPVVLPAFGSLDGFKVKPPVVKKTTRNSGARATGGSSREQPNNKSREQSNNKSREQSNNKSREQSNNNQSTPSSAPAPNGSITSIAAGLMGIRYRWGGTSTSGIDCSGFTQMVYRRAGISIPRTAEAQRRAATKVSNPRPGDLVFFGYPASHTGIYAGGGMMYDAGRRLGRTVYRKIWTSSGVSYGRF
ncbi:MAG: hypothetical protein CSA84_00690 [Actinomycetales bacterium]|nr:MAG: hypothetical protein CSA84_00690 [Actinomycetales bacterium]